MTFQQYVTRLFLAAWLSITFLLAVLFNFVEFFEKLARVKQATVGQITYFLGLNFLPSAFDVMPISIWLATLFVLRELTTQQSWDFLQLLGFAPGNLLRLLLGVSSILCLLVGVLRESFILDIAKTAEQYKYVQFKKQPEDLIFGSWFELEHQRFCYIEELDLTKKKGKGVLLVALSSAGAVASVSSALEITLNPEQEILELGLSTGVDIPSQVVTPREQQIFHSPYFFNALHTKQISADIFNLYKLILFQSLLPRQVVVTLWQRLLETIWYYLSFLCYPIMTIYLFMAPFSPYVRWGLALIPYPVMVFLGMVIKALF
jgi:lipopolysaccharide export LptBFGC system permease protein LptF